MHLELDDTQAHALEDVLVAVLADTRMEIAQTDNSSFKSGLRAHKDVLQSILNQLHTPQSP